MDPGIGFAKRAEQSLATLAGLGGSPCWLPALVDPRASRSRRCDGPFRPRNAMADSAAVTIAVLCRRPSSACTRWNIWSTPSAWRMLSGRPPDTPDPCAKATVVAATVFEGWRFVPRGLSGRILLRRHEPSRLLPALHRTAPTPPLLVDVCSLLVVSIPDIRAAQADSWHARGADGVESPRSSLFLRVAGFQLETLNWLIRNIIGYVVFAATSSWLQADIRRLDPPRPRASCFEGSNRKVADTILSENCRRRRRRCREEDRRNRRDRATDRSALHRAAFRSMQAQLRSAGQHFQPSSPPPRRCGDHPVSRAARPPVSCRSRSTRASIANSDAPPRGESGHRRKRCRRDRGSEETGRLLDHRVTGS